MTRLSPAILAGLIVAYTCSVLSYAQSTSNAGLVRGSVLDQSGAAIANATVQIQNPVSQYSRTTQTDSQGTFVLDNIPYNNYHASATAPGFQTTEQDINVRSSVPIELKMNLKIGTSTTSVR
jgi:hypothetical protein